MTHRVYNILSLLLLMSLVTLVSSGAATSSSVLAAVPQGDYQMVSEGPGDFKGGCFSNTVLTRRTVTIKSFDKSRKGIFTSPVILLPNPALQVTPSWNISGGQDDGWLLQLQVVNDEKEASPWFYFSSGGTHAFKTEKVTECSWAKISGDTLVLTKPAASVRYRVTMFGTRSTPSFKGFSMSLKITPAGK
ncbi:MAG: hypothetical protein AB9903_12245 [Vulcanimicrobiota bacterium]